MASLELELLDRDHLAQRRRTAHRDDGWGRDRSAAFVVLETVAAGFPALHAALAAVLIEQLVLEVFAVLGTGEFAVEYSMADLYPDVAVEKRVA